MVTSSCSSMLPGLFMTAVLWIGWTCSRETTTRFVYVQFHEQLMFPRPTAAGDTRTFQRSSCTFLRQGRGRDGGSDGGSRAVELLQLEGRRAQPKRPLMPPVPPVEGSADLFRTNVVHKATKHHDAAGRLLFPAGSQFSQLQSI